MKYGVVLLDPPWEFRVWGAATNCRTAASHYGVQGDEWIVNLPVASVLEKEATVLTWVTNPHFPVAFRAIEAWGLEYKACITWVKMARAGVPKIGLGYHARGATEHLLIAQRGGGHAPAPSRRPPSVFFSPRGEHSAKPQYQYDLAEGYAGPYLECFHRPSEGRLFPARENWTFLGNEVPGCGDIVSDLCRLAAEPDRPAEVPLAARAAVLPLPPELSLFPEEPPVRLPL